MGSVPCWREEPTRTGTFSESYDWCGVTESMVDGLRVAPSLVGNAFPQASQSIVRRSLMSSSRTINDLPHLPQLMQSRSSFV